MSLVNNIHSQTIMKAAASSALNASASVNSAGTGSLEDFIGVILKQVNQVEKASKTNTADQANTAAAPSGVQEAVEKIAARLNIDPKDPNAAEKITDALSNIADGVDPALTADLSSEFATIIQAADDNSQIDDDMLANIEAALQTLMDNPDMTPEQLAAFSDDLVKDLKAKGIPDATIIQYIDTLQLPIGEQAAALTPPVSDDAAPASLASLVPAATTIPSSGAPPLASDTPTDGTDADSAAPLLAAVKAAGIGDLSIAGMEAVGDAEALPHSDIAAVIAGDLKRAAPQPASLTEKKTAGKPAASADAVKLDVSVSGDAKADPAPKAEVPVKAEARTSTLALVNAMASGDDNFSAQTTGLQQDNGMNSLHSLLGLRADAAQNNMINYMQPDQKLAASTMQMIAIQMQQNAANKTSTFTMQLDPADLGRLDIEMTFEKSGSVKAHVSADRPETLAMLQRDSQHLNRILQQAGLDVDDGSLTFDLRQDNHAQQDNSYGQEGHGRSAIYQDGYKANEVMQAQIAASVMGTITQSGVNIMV